MPSHSRAGGGNEVLIVFSAALCSQRVLKSPFHEQNPKDFLLVEEEQLLAGDF